MKLLGYRLSKSSLVGRSIIVCDQVILDDEATIGHFNIIRHLETLHLGPGAQIGSRNWISAATADGFFEGEGPRNRRLLLGAGARVTRGHRLDCSNQIEFEARSNLAGSGSQVLTHSIDVKTGRQRTRPVTVGFGATVQAACVLLPGSLMPEGSELLANSTLQYSSEPYPSYFLLGGVPATKLRPLPSSSESALAPFLTRPAE